jgi:serine/threonine protein phosphatase PrpC
MMEGIKKGILRGFLELDEKLRKIPEVASGEDKSGSTAVGALISGLCLAPSTSCTWPDVQSRLADKYVIIANCGDSRGVVCVSGKPALATQDHKPSNEPEKERIQNAGGSVMIQRVNGSLAVSRALGDFEYKNVDGKGPTEQLVSPEPEFYIKERDGTRDEFLVLACDGVWDVMSNEEICRYISGVFSGHFHGISSSFIGHRMKIHENLETICNEVIDTCLYKGSRDNMSIIIIAFHGAPKVDAAAVKIENELSECPLLL